MFEGAKLDPLSVDQATFHSAARLFRWPAFRLVQARGSDRLRLGRGAGHAASPQRRMVGGHRRRAVPLSAGRSLRRSSRRRARLPSTRRRTGWPLRRCSDCSKTRAATCGSPRSRHSIERSRPLGTDAAGRVRDLAHSPGLPSFNGRSARVRLAKTAPATSGSASTMGWPATRTAVSRRSRRATDCRQARSMNIHVDRSGRLWLASDARRTRSRRQRRRGATHVCQLHDRAGPVEQQHRSDHRRRHRPPLRRRRARTRPARSGDGPRQAFHHR